MSNKLGLVSVSFRQHSPAEILTAMKSAELTVIEWGSDVHAPKEDLDTLHELVKLQTVYGIECCSYGTYFKLGVTPMEELQDYINAAKILGTNILRLWCGNKNSEDYTDKERDSLFAECKVAADIAEKNGVILCMECHNKTYTNTKQSAYELMQTVNSNNFRMYWQPNQYKSDIENFEYAQLISSYTVHLHVFNWKGKKKYTLCEAKEIWKEYLACFENEKTLLLEFMPDDKIETLENEATALREIVKWK